MPRVMMVPMIIQRLCRTSTSQHFDMRVMTAATQRKVNQQGGDQDGDNEKSHRSFTRTQELDHLNHCPCYDTCQQKPGKWQRR